MRACASYARFEVMTKDPHSLIRQCLTLMIQPISAFCVSRGVHFQDFLEIAKKSFVRAAEIKLRNDTRSDPSTSRLSVMTGLQRPEIVRLRSEESARSSRDFITRIIGQWSADKRFLDRRRLPRPLTISGRGSDFRRLVQTVSKDLNPHTVRFELERLGLIHEVDGLVRLTQPVYLSTGDVAETLQIAAEDVRDLLAASEENAFASSMTPNLHARTQYDNIPDDLVPDIKKWCLELGREIHLRVREYLAQKDLDINPAQPGVGRNRVVLGTFSRVESLTHRNEDQ